MNSGVRHKVQRIRRKRLKADAVVLLGRIVALTPEILSSNLLAEIAEMQMRLQPPPGIKAPIIRTGYTK